jgi:hypothetical protein
MHPPDPGEGIAAALADLRALALAAAEDADLGGCDDAEGDKRDEGVGDGEEEEEEEEDAEDVNAKRRKVDAATGAGAAAATTAAENKKETNNFKNKEKKPKKPRPVSAPSYFNNGARKLASAMRGNWDMTRALVLTRVGLYTSLPIA